MSISIKAGAKEYAVGFEFLESIASSIPDTEEYMDLFQTLAGSGNVSVRAAIAYKDKIKSETVNILAKDSQVEVLRNLANQAEACGKVGSDEVDRWIALGDVELCTHIANNINNYKKCDEDVLLGKLSKHKDPKVRGAIAENYETPKKILKSLLKDKDPDVAQKAKSTMEN